MGSSESESSEEIAKPASAPARPRSTMLVAVVIVVVLIVAAIAGAWAFGLFGTEDDEKVLVIAMSSDVQAMDPAKTSAMYGPPGLIYETLITRDLNGDYADGLALDWNMNRDDPDHPYFEIELRQGVSFHDGTPFNTAAVRDIIDYYAQEDSWVQYEFWAVYGCENKTGWPDAGIWCKDDYNMVLNLTWADVALEFNLSHLYGSMLWPKALEEDGLDLYGTANGHVIGTGPYMLDEWVPGDHITLVKNPDYDWGFSWYENKGPAKIDKIIYRIIADQNTRFAGFESGSIDVLQQVPPSKVTEYEGEDNVSVITERGQGTYHVEFNCQKDPWDDANLRKAFGYAVDRAQILSTVWHGIGEEGVNCLAPWIPESQNVPAEYNYSYDVDRALELFELAGFTNLDSDVWLENETGELSLELWTTNKGEDIQMGEIVQAQFEDVGVHVTLTPYAETQLRDEAAEGNQEAILFWYSWPRAEILDWHFGTWAAGGSNTGWYMDEVFDNYVTNWTYAETEEEFSDNATAALIRLQEQGAWCTLIYWHQIFAVHDYVTFQGEPGWAVNPLGQEQVINIVDVDINK